MHNKIQTCTCALILAGIVGGAAYLLIYSSEKILDDSIPKCFWKEDVLDSGCIHHRVFILDNEKLVSTRIYVDCVLDTPYRKNATYWCVQDEGSSSYKPHFSQPEKEKNAYLSGGMIAVIIIFSIFFLFAFGITILSWCEETCSARDSTMPHKEINTRQSRRRYKRNQASRKVQTIQNYEIEIPNWETPV